MKAPALTFLMMAAFPLAALAEDSHIGARCSIVENARFTSYQSDALNLADTITLTQDFKPEDGPFNLLTVTGLNIPMIGDFKALAVSITNSTKMQFHREEGPGLVAMLQLPSSPGRTIKNSGRFKAQLVVLPTDPKNFGGFALGLGGKTLFYNLRCQSYTN